MVVVLSFELKGNKCNLNQISGDSRLYCQLSCVREFKKCKDPLVTLKEG